MRSQAQTDYVLGHKTDLNKYKKIENISSIFFNHNSMKLDVNYKNNPGKITNMWILNNMLLNNYWGNEENKGEIKNT